MARYSTISLVYLILGAVNFTQAEYDEGPSLISDGLAQFSDFAGQCVDEKMMNSDDPIEFAFNAMNNYCTEPQAKKFELALKNYEKCDGASITDFIESYWDSVVGMAMTCSGYFYSAVTTTMAEYESDFFEMKNVPFRKRLPDECIESLLGNHGFGNFMRNNFMSPKKDYDCMKNLGREVPSCTLRVWPVPLVGPVFQFFSCASTNMEAMYDDVCDDEIDMLTNCLPSLDEIKNADDGSCETWIKSCTIIPMNREEEPSYAMLMPAPLSAAPFPDICLNDDGNARARYKAYQQACLLKEDLEIWSEPRTSLFGGSMGSSSSTGRKSSSSSNTLVMFFGFMFGVVGTVGVAFLIDYRNRRAGDVSMTDGNGIITRLSHNYESPVGTRELS